MFIRKRVTRGPSTKQVRRRVFHPELLSAEARKLAAMLEEKQRVDDGQGGGEWINPGWQQVHADVTARGWRWEAVEEPVPAREHTSYAIVEAYRDAEGRPRQRQLASLGRHPTPEGKLAELRELHAQAVAQASPEAVARRVGRLAEARALMGGGAVFTDEQAAAWREAEGRHAQHQVDELAEVIAHLERLAAQLADRGEAAA